MENGKEKLTREHFVKFYISKNVIGALKNNNRPILTDLLFCKRGAILLTSKDILNSCELDNCKLDCEIVREAHARIEKMV